MNKRILFATIIIVLVVAAGAMCFYHLQKIRSQQGSTVATDTALKTYTNQEYGFSFEYPAALDIDQTYSDLIGKDGHVYIVFNFDNHRFYTVSFLNCPKWDAYLKENKITRGNLPYYDCKPSHERYLEYLKKDADESGHQIKKIDSAVPFVSYANYNPEGSAYGITYLAFKDDTEIKFSHSINHCFDDCSVVPDAETDKNISNQIVNLSISDPGILFGLKTIQEMVNSFSISH